MLPDHLFDRAFAGYSSQRHGGERMDCENTTRIRMGSSLGGTRKMRWRGLWVWTGPRLGWQPFGFFFSPFFGFVGLQSVQWLSRLGRGSRVSRLSLLLFVLCTVIGAACSDPAGCRAVVWGWASDAGRQRFALHLGRFAARGYGYPHRCKVNQHMLKIKKMEGS